MIHFEESTKERQARLGGNPHSQCLCGNGNYHAIKTRDIKEVNCPKCLELLKYTIRSKIDKNIIIHTYPEGNGYHLSKNGVIDSPLVLIKCEAIRKAVMNEALKVLNND